MTALPSPDQVAGLHISVYETLYSLIDPKSHGQIGAMDAAKFLKKSYLSDVVLSKIWDIADPTSRGFLDKPGMFVALKLCALAQQGHNLTLTNVYMDIDPPKMGEILNSTKIASYSQSILPIKSNCWAINALERTKYEQLFRSLEPVHGYVPGYKVKGVLMDSKLPLEILGKIWDLADIDKDGKLNQHEFIIAMHLVYKALENNAVPNVLPTELLESSKMQDIDASLNTSQVLTTTSHTAENISANVCTKLLQDMKNSEWIVSYEEQKAADRLFEQADEDLDGFVSGAEIKDIFFQSGLAQHTLAHIWNLCDISQSGKLNNQQFSLAMWLIKQKLNGIDLPTCLTTEMIPPSFRKKNAEFLIDNNNICEFSNPELEMINKDISDIIREKHILEQDISQKEADIKIKNGEIKSLQSELDTLAATLRQLDNQKGEAQKRLKDLKAQVEKLKEQATDQESALHIQEDELNIKRQEIECLKMKEQSLEMHQLENKNKLHDLTATLQKIQLQTSQTKASITQLEEQQRQLIDAITQYDTAFAMGDTSVVPDSFIMFKPKLEEFICKIKNINNSINEEVWMKENSENMFNNNEEIHCDPFTANNEIEKKIEGGSVNLFDDLSNKMYDPFADELLHKKTMLEYNQVKDPFGEDPFAALHAPVRSESPSPALPPKKSKQPPPRPAPPRPSQGGQSLVPSAGSSAAESNVDSTDPFADKTSFKCTTTNASFEFADFSKFDSK